MIRRGVESCTWPGSCRLRMVGYICFIQQYNLARNVYLHPKRIRMAGWGLMELKDGKLEKISKLNVSSSSSIQGGSHSFFSRTSFSPWKIQIVRKDGHDVEVLPAEIEALCFASWLVPHAVLTKSAMKITLSDLRP